MRNIFNNIVNPLHVHVHVHSLYVLGDGGAFVLYVTVHVCAHVLVHVHACSKECCTCTCM